MALYHPSCDQDGVEVAGVHPRHHSGRRIVEQVTFIRSVRSFTLDLVAKDLDLILELADRVGAAMPPAQTNRKEVRDALVAGMTGRDMSARRVLRGIERAADGR